MSQPEFHQLSNNVHRLDLVYKANFLFPSIPVSIYLVQDNSRYYLIDAGPPNSEKLIIQALAKFFDKEINDEKNFSILKEIGAIILTHYHVDHCGSARALYELSDQSMHISCHQDEVDFLAEVHPNFDNVKSDNWVFKMSKKLIGQPTLGIPGISHTEIMNAYGASEEKKCGKMKFCHCPGHTPGHCCFYHEEDRVLIGSGKFLIEIEDIYICVNI